MGMNQFQLWRALAKRFNDPDIQRKFDAWDKFYRDNLKQQLLDLTKDQYYKQWMKLTKDEEEFIDEFVYGQKRQGWAL